MDEIDLSPVDVEDVLKRLTLYADWLFFSLAGLTGGACLSGLGESPDDLAMGTVAKFLDPLDHTVAWKGQHGTPTTEGLLRFLREVLKKDLLDLLRRKAHETTILLDSQPSGEDQEGTAPRKKTLDEFASSVEGPDGQVLREEQHTRLLSRLEHDPELRDLLAVQLDPDGYQAHTNQDLADLLGTTVGEIENRKKRLGRRLLRVHAEMREVATRGLSHG